MKKSNLIIIAIAAFSMFSACENSSQEAIKEKRKEEMTNKGNRVSPPATASATFGTNTVTVIYSSPAVKNRPIWGTLVPFGEIWRTGANEATTIEFTQDVTIQGQTLAKGIYSFFTIPAETEWTLIFNTDETQWGAFKYDQSADALRVNVKPIATESVTENLLFTVVQDTTPSAGIIRLNWEMLQIDCPFVSVAAQ